MSVAETSVQNPPSFGPDFWISALFKRDSSLITWITSY